MFVGAPPNASQAMSEAAGDALKIRNSDSGSDSRCAPPTADSRQAARVPAVRFKGRRGIGEEIGKAMHNRQEMSTSSLLKLFMGVGRK